MRKCATVCNLVMTTHLKSKSEENKKDITVPPHFTGDYRRHDRDHQITKFRIHFTFRQNQANNTKSGQIFQKSSIKIH